MDLIKLLLTNKEGVANLNNLSWGTYTVRETKAPIGYELSSKETNYNYKC